MALGTLEHNEATHHLAPTDYHVPSAKTYLGGQKFER
jgi:hypothetical protein